MSGLSTVTPAVVAQINRIAKIRQNSRGNVSGNSFWTKVDGAQDETYENIVKGTAMTAIDTLLAAGMPWSQTTLAQWFIYHEQYYAQGLSQATWTGFINTLIPGKRVPLDFAETLRDARGSASAISAKYIYPKGTLATVDTDASSAGYHEFGSVAASAGTVVDGIIDKTRCIGGVVLGVNAVASTSASGLKLTLTQAPVTGATNLTNVVDVSLAGAAQYKHTIVGKCPITTTAASGQKTILCSGGVTALKAGTYALVYESDDLHEIVSIDSLATGTVTVTDNLINTYTSTNSPYIVPLCIDAVYNAGTVTNGPVHFYAQPDRLIAL